MSTDNISSNKNTPQDQDSLANASTLGFLSSGDGSNESNASTSKRRLLCRSSSASGRLWGHDDWTYYQDDRGCWYCYNNQDGRTAWLDGLGLNCIEELGDLDMPPGEDSLSIGIVHDNSDAMVLTAGILFSSSDMDDGDTSFVEKLIPMWSKQKDACQFVGAMKKAKKAKVRVENGERLSMSDWERLWWSIDGVDFDAGLGIAHFHWQWKEIKNNKDIKPPVVLTAADMLLYVQLMDTLEQQLRHCYQMKYVKQDQRLEKSCRAAARVTVETLRRLLCSAIKSIEFPSEVDSPVLPKAKQRALSKSIEQWCEYHYVPCDLSAMQDLDFADIEELVLSALKHFDDTLGRNSNEHKLTKVWYLFHLVQPAVEGNYKASNIVTKLKLSRNWAIKHDFDYTFPELTGRLGFGPETTEYIYRIADEMLGEESRASSEHQMAFAQVFAQIVTRLENHFPYFLSDRAVIFDRIIRETVPLHEGQMERMQAEIDTKGREIYDLFVRMREKDNEIAELRRQVSDLTRSLAQHSAT